MLWGRFSYCARDWRRRRGTDAPRGAVGQTPRAPGTRDATKGGAPSRCVPIKRSRHTQALRASALFFDDAYFLPPKRAARAAPFLPPRGLQSDDRRDLAARNRFDDRPSVRAARGADDLTPLCFTANSRGEYTDHDVEEFRTDRLYPKAPAGAATRPPTTLVLIANRGTASAAEAFASALRDNGAATLVGERSFGKALVQHAFPLPDGGNLRLTVAELLSPRQKHLAPATLADLRDPAAARGGLAPDHPLGRVCAPAPVSDVAADACVLAALEAVL